jgi:hypothetical protein
MCTVLLPPGVNPIAVKNKKIITYRRLGGPQGGLDCCGKSRLPPRFDPRTVQPVASRYTDWASKDRRKTILSYPSGCKFKIDLRQRYTPSCFRLSVSWLIHNNASVLLQLLTQWIYNVPTHLVFVKVCWQTMDNNSFIKAYKWASSFNKEGKKNVILTARERGETSRTSTAPVFIEVKMFLHKS